MSGQRAETGLWGELKTKLAELDPAEKKTLVRLALLIFTILFTYPLVRSTTTAIFLNHHGAANTPTVWLFSIFALSIAIAIYNRYQAQLSIHLLFVWTCALSIIIFLVGLWLVFLGHPLFAYLLYIWKEVYIILLVHMTLGHLNSSVSVALAKMMYGPFGAIGSTGGLLGGLLTSRLAGDFEAWGILAGSCLLIALSGVIFYGMGRRNCLSEKPASERQESPLKSLHGAFPYVLSLCLIIVMTQFCINLANFKFNLLFDELISSEREKTQYLGVIYSSINGLSLAVQLLVIPVVFRVFSLRSIHIFVPMIYLFLVYFGLLGEVSVLFLVSVAFIGIKGLDYSLFSAAKEILYFSLGAKQKYGAKYLVDMFFYRFGKGLISLLLIFYQSNKFVNTMLVLSLILWGLALIPLFYYRPKNDE